MQFPFIFYLARGFLFSFLAAYFSAPIVHRIYRGKSAAALGIKYGREKVHKVFGVCMYYEK